MIRVDETSRLGVAVSTDCNGRFAKLDPYTGASSRSPSRTATWRRRVPGRSR